MVDGKYIGRGDKTKHYLTHPEVLRYHQQQRASELDAMALLDVEFGRDIFATPTPVHAHGFWLAEPIAGRPNMMLSLTEGPIQHHRIINFKSAALVSAAGHAGVVEVGADDQRFSPNLGGRRSHSIDEPMASP